VNAGDNLGTEAGKAGYLRKKDCNALSTGDSKPETKYKLIIRW